MYAVTNDLYNELRWTAGGRFDFWISHSAVVERFVKAKKLVPVEIEHLQVAGPVSVRASARTTKTARTKLLSPWIYGGIRVPHLHLRSDIYLVKDAQWREFSGSTVKELHRKLAEVKTVGFDQLMELSDAIGSIST